MPLIVNGKKYASTPSKDTLDRIISEISKLPEPEVVPLEGVKGKIASPETLICLQREAVYIDESNPTNPFRYVGSKNVNSCLMIYLYNEIDHFGIHVDHTSNFNLIELLSGANYPSLNIILVGGIIEENSELYLRNFLAALLEAANILDFTFTFVAQKILERNKFSEVDQAEFIYDKLLEKADMVSRKYFGRTLDLSHFTRTVDDLRFRESTIDHHELMMLAGLFSQVAEVYSQSQRANIEIVHTMARSSGILPQAEERDPKKIEQSYQYFLCLLDALFSKQGLNLSHTTYQSIYPAAKLRNFVFDLQNHRVHLVSLYQESAMAPTEIDRAVKVLDAFPPPYYHFFYDGRTATYNMPICSGQFLKASASFKAITELDFIADEEIKRFATSLGVDHSIPTQNLLMKYIMGYPISLPASEVASVFYKPQDFYQDQEVINRNLQVLRSKYPGLNITAKIRHYPEYIVDALVACQDGSAAEEIKMLLEKENLRCHLLNIEEKAYVCVSAINLGHYAQAINNLTPSLVPSSLS